MTRVLLTSVCRPFGGPGEGDSVGAELFHAQVTRAQGAYSLRQTIRVWALDYLAENIQAPAVTLHYPSKQEFVDELKGHRYTHVGINFVVATFHKVKEMVRLVREHSPSSTIILGGYGTVLPDEVLRPQADAICREEGVGFMRKLLGEPVDGPIQHPHAPTPTPTVFSRQVNSVVGHVTAGLGCPNGCDFCCTSHFFKRRYERFCETGRDVYESLLATRERARADGVDMTSFIIIDEDFFLHHKRARQFLECVREGGEPLSLMGFGSVRGLSKFTAREIGEMGFDLIWNAFEGKQSGYGKQKGMPIADLYKGLQSVGCGQLCSMIIGFPYQDEATMKAEFDELMALFPAMFQCLIYFAFPGTPFHAQVIKEDRYRKRYKDSPDLRRWDGFAMHFDHPKFADPSDIERIQKDLYRQDLERLGPSPLRYARVWLDGCINLRNDPNPLLAARAERLGELSRCVLGLVSPSMIPGYPAHQQAQWDQLRRDIIKYTGELSFTDKVVGRVAPGLRRFFDATTRHRLIQQPGLLRTEHRIAGGEATLHTRHVFRLQGGRFSGMGKAVLENVKDRWAERQADPVHPFEPQETTPVTRQCGMLPSVYAGVANPSAPPCHSQHEPETTQPEAREDEVRPPSAVPAL